MISIGPYFRTCVWSIDYYSYIFHNCFTAGNYSFYVLQSFYKDIRILLMLITLAFFVIVIVLTFFNSVITELSKIVYQLFCHYYWLCYYSRINFSNHMHYIWFINHSLKHFPKRVPNRYSDNHSLKHIVPNRHADNHSLKYDVPNRNSDNHSLKHGVPNRYSDNQPKIYNFKQILWQSLCQGNCSSKFNKSRNFFIAK